MLTTIHLHGRLGRLFGREYTIGANTPAEALRALCFRVKGFRNYLFDSEKNGIVYRLMLGRKTVGPEQLMTPLPSNEVHLFPIPVVAAKKGVISIIVGVVLIAATILSSGAGAGLWGNYMAALGGKAGIGWGMAASMGTALVLGGISQLIANPKMPNLTSDANNDRSYIFNGSAQTTRQGGPIPIGYGRLHVGAQVISQGVTTSNEKRASVGNTGEEDEDATTGEGVYGLEATKVEFVREAGTADFIGGINERGNAQIPVLPAALASP
jgi:predicted phage tail protein